MATESLPCLSLVSFSFCGNNIKCFVIGTSTISPFLRTLALVMRSSAIECLNRMIPFHAAESFVDTAVRVTFNGYRFAVAETPTRTPQPVPQKRQGAFCHDIIPELSVSLVQSPKLIPGKSDPAVANALVSRPLNKLSSIKFHGLFFSLVILFHRNQRSGLKIAATAVSSVSSGVVLQ